ncbi:protein kinase [Gordonia sp. (in: high G+C Gram-positive bacteria)]|uniref:protein kinase domain-containing protein n=1 Tax=Gordonia sp. (in: high G+C Gram-positive bacteria) TaxID=84139 RepID=UPI0016984BD1|nr:protein kinase [Gordonia sp. (in: high G+C Gram-positive bacteria)]NLG46001.1 protein kinase [Gordonia sp. (in: high G+C Gram-positive bacteria)]
MSAEPGSQIAGYRVVSRLGSGGMGDVYIVENEQLQRQEAMKVISVGGASNDDFQQRFSNEARTAASLDHPSIITVHSYGVDEGLPWFTMSYLKGPDLSSTQLSPADAVTVMEQVASGLDYAHARTVVHRDIKPANIVITRTDDGAIARAVMLDFGIAKLADSPQLTAVNSVVGTAAYTAPEIISGQHASSKSDQYSLACTAYQLFAGTAPFKADSTTALMMAHVQQPPPSLGNVRPDLAPLGPVLQRAMAKDPAARYPNCRAFADDLKRALAQTQAGTSTTVAPVPGVGPGHTPAPPTNQRFAGTPPPSGHVSASGMTPPSNPGMQPPHSAPGMAAPYFASHPGTSNPGMTPPPSGNFNAQSYGGTVPGGPAYGAPNQGYPGQPNAGAFTPPPMGPGAPQQAWGAPGQAPKKSKKPLFIGLAVLAVVLIAAVTTLAVLMTGGEPEETVTAHPNMQLVTNSNTTCSIKDESLYCWGNNSSSQIGDGGTTTQQTPIKVPGLTGVTAVSIGNYLSKNEEYPTTTCAIASGDVYCWGRNHYGQIGDGSTEDRSSPVKVPGLPKATAVSTNDTATCAVTEEKEVYCWGGGEGGQIGTGDTSERVTSPQKVNNLSDVKQISSNGGTVCAIAAENDLYCWGNNGSGQLGDGTTDQRNTPVKVKNLQNVTSVSIGRSVDTEKKIIYRTVCAVADGKVHCWGSDINDDGYRKVPVEVNGIANAEQVAVDVSTACATSEGKLLCWGNNFYGQVGNGSTERVMNPTEVNGLSDVEYVTTGFSTTCAEVASGDTYCWGLSGQGQVGNPSADSEKQTRPIKVTI